MKAENDNSVNNDIGQKAAIVTGASSGIGLATAKRLLECGYKVYGIGRDFSRLNTPDEMIKVQLDLLDTDRMVKTISEIDKAEETAILVNNAGVGYYGLHEQLDISHIQEMVRTNLEVPMIMTRLLLKSLKRNSGYVINISSHTANQANPHGCAYGAAKAGLSGFSRSLFAEERKYGLHVVNIEPDMTDTNLYRNSDFGVDDDVMAYLSPEEVADAVIYAVSRRGGMNLTNIAIEPQLNRIKKIKK